MVRNPGIQACSLMRNVNLCGLACKGGKVTIAQVLGVQGLGIADHLRFIRLNADNAPGKATR